MKKTILRVALIAVICLAIVFCSLLLNEKADTSDAEDLCRHSARLAYSRFSEYREDGAAYDYHYAVAELESFRNAYMALVTEEKGSTNPYCIYLNQLIGKLMEFPELTPLQIDELVSITSMLANDIHDDNAYHKVFSLYNELNT